MGGSVHHGVPGTRSTVSLLKLERKKIGIVTFLDNLTISTVFFVLEPFRKCMSRFVLKEMQWATELKNAVLKEKQSTLLWFSRIWGHL